MKVVAEQHGKIKAPQLMRMVAEQHVVEQGTKDIKLNI
jgi:hypothetical protein